MCEHVTLEARDGSRALYSLMDCGAKRISGVPMCQMSDKSIAHLMASGQFRRIEILGEKQEDYKDRQGWSFTARGAERVFEEKDFPAFIEKHLGAASMQERHHAPEAIGQWVR